MLRRFVASVLPLGLVLACSSTGPTSNGGGGTAGSSGAGVAGTGGSVAMAGSAGASAGSSAGGTAAGTGGSAGGQSGGTGGSGGSGGEVGGGGSGGQVAAVELRITTSNIRYGTAADGINVWDERKALLIEVLKAQNADSLGVQEALEFQLEELDVALPEYDRVGVGRDDGDDSGEFSAIFYLKDRYEAVASGTFWFSDTPEEPGSMNWGNTLPRICTWARLKNIATGRHYYHFNLHIDHLSQPSRQKSAQLVASRIAMRPEQADPVVLTGDFNAEPDSVEMKYLLGTGQVDAQQTPVVLNDAWLSLHQNDANSTTYHAWNGGMTGGTHIDYVLYASGITPKSSEIVFTHDGDVYPSDHYPVSAVLEVAP